MRTDQELTELIGSAYAEERFGVSRHELERRAAGAPRRRLAVAAAAVAVLGSTVWVSVATEPPRDAVPADVAASASPSPTAGTADTRCADQARTDGRLDPPAPPLRLRAEGPEHTLLVHWEPLRALACLVDGSGRVDAVYELSTSPAPEGPLTVQFMTVRADPPAFYAFGRMPAGTARVELRFAGGGSVEARLFDGWYAAIATGTTAERERFDTIDQVTAFAADGTATSVTVNRHR